MNSWKTKWLSLLFLTYAPFAHSSEFRLKLYQYPQEKVSNLFWNGLKDTQEPPIKTRSVVRPGQGPYYVLIRGKYLKSKNLSLTLEQKSLKTNIIKSKSISLKGDGSFELEVDIDEKQTEFKIMAADAKGLYEESKNLLLFPEWEKFKENPGKEKSWSLSPGLGITGVTYRSGTYSLDEALLNVSLSGNYQLGSQWDVSGSCNYTGLLLTNNRPGITLLFFKANASVRYKLPGLSEPWSLSLGGGAYYSTTFSSGATLGYHNLQGPEILSLLSRRFSGGRSAWVYFKYSLIFDGAEFATANNAELSAGAGYTFKAFQNRQALAATLDYSYLNLNLIATHLRVNTYTLGLTYRF